MVLNNPDVVGTRPKPVSGPPVEVARLRELGLDPYVRRRRALFFVNMLAFNRSEFFF